jgi:L-lactate dehydrogenase complex protein LldF
MLKRSKMDMVGGKMKNWIMKNFFRKSWGKHREMPEVAQKSFSKQWTENNPQ